MARPLPDWPLTLNTGRYRDQWHTMTRTGLAPKLARHREEPLVEIHADDAVRFDLKAGDLAKVSTPQGASVFRVALSDGQRPGEIFTPIHWTDQISTGGRTGLLPRPLVDPISGQPGYKSTPAMLARVDTEWKGFLILREKRRSRCRACGPRGSPCRAARSMKSLAMAIRRGSRPACPRASGSKPSTPRAAPAAWRSSSKGGWRAC
jgi:predicted molibdopterin-dependent oxidoreductase YjgC